MSWTRASTAAAMILASGSIAAANDSIGHLSLGGIVLGQTQDIEMRAEDLFVSSKEIRVHYRFFNKSDHDVSTLIAFPLPDIAAPTDAVDVAIPVMDSPNFVDFKTQVGGTPVAIELEQRAVALGIDRTDLLKGLNVPLAPYLEAATTAVRNLPPERQAELLRLGILRSEETDIGQGMKTYLNPSWTLRATFYWTQMFPAGKETIVDHQYKPSVGASVETSLGASYADAATTHDYQNRYCVNREFIASATRARAKKKGANGSVGEQRLEYVLVTGANWAGPIKDFRLVIDKGAPDNLLSVCGKVKKISPTQFEIRQSDYLPERNLEVLILEPPR